MLENSVVSKMSNATERMRSSRFARRSLPSGLKSRNRFFRSTDNPKFDVPTVDSRSRYDSMFFRHPEDRQYIKPYDWLDDKPCKPKIPEIIHAQPSYTNFRVPFPMVCKERYNDFIKKYEEQFGHEIKSLIDNQPTAREATYLVRIVAYTTLWPPYHNENELNHTSHNFYRLTPQENTRFQYIMTHDFS